ncbi:type 4b pilus protein PilO2 [Defluviimonas salinarum]|uniref:Type 4b pilus protein PilO2 n=1 Tax=Defluviimonas salinarum TaxID=2992147 RepID=A0ABT3J4F4_9RHOB|nr:type 4b pilus protein PilO2 [Defluviimonas salinarum]MCW3782571.1 type 4b pilus protein PilO2 [Defluviimonas salinarum]
MKFRKREKTTDDGAPEGEVKPRRFARVLGRKTAPEVGEAGDGFVPENPRSKKATPKASKGTSMKSLSFSASAASAAELKKSISTSPDIFMDEPGVIAFGKKKAALGLSWTTRDEDKTVKAQIRDLNEQSAEDPASRTVNYQFYTDTKKTGFVGLGSPDLGHKSGMKALVTLLSPAITGPRWIGVFRLDESKDLWWVGSIRDSKVFEDQIITGRHRAEEIFLTELQAPDWSSVFAPEDWGIAQTRGERLHEVVDFRGGEKLKSISPVKDNLPRIALVAAVAAVAAGGFLFFQNMKAKELRELEELRKRVESQVSLGPQDFPWYNVTRADLFISTCMSEIEKSIIVIPGWEAQPISCTISGGQGTISTGWSRMGGRFSWLRTAIPGEDPQPTMSPDGTTAAFSRSFTAPYDELSFADQPWGGAQIDSWVRERLQVFGLELSMRPNQENRDAAGAKPLFNSHDIRIQTPYAMRNYGDLLRDVPALVPQVLIYNVQTSSWDLALKAYHPPILPVPKQ